jgi:hypothetical protein
MLAVQTLIARLPSDELRVVLDAYPTAGRPFWYNVIACLDEHVFAPTPQP